MQRPKLRRLRTDHLSADPRYQRHLDTNRVSRMVRTYNPLLVEPLIVNLRTDGSYYVICGQHRHAMLLQVGEGYCNCLVHEGLTAEQEAELFKLTAEHHKPLSPYDRYRSELFYGYEPTASIDETVREAGFKVSSGPEANGIQAVTAVKQVWHWGGRKLLAETLEFIAPWIGENIPHGRDGQLISGVALFLRTADPQKLDRQRLSMIFSVTPPATIVLQAAQRQRNIGGGNRSVYVRDEILSLYNKRLRTRLRLVDELAEEAVTDE